MGVAPHDSGCLRALVSITPIMWSGPYGLKFLSWPLCSDPDSKNKTDPVLFLQAQPLQSRQDRHGECLWWNQNQGLCVPERKVQALSSWQEFGLWNRERRERMGVRSRIQNSLESVIEILRTKNHRDFPGGPVVTTPRFHCRGLRFNPWSGNQDPCMLRSQKKKKNKEWYIGKSPAWMLSSDFQLDFML